MDSGKLRCELFGNSGYAVGSGYGRVGGYGVNSYLLNGNNFLHYVSGVSGSSLSSLVRRTAGEKRCAESNSGN